MPTISDAQALQILRDSRDKSFDAAAQGELAGLRGLLGAKQAQLSATKLQAQGEKLDSFTKLAAGTAGIGLNYKASVHAASPAEIRKMKDEADAAFAARQSNSAARRAGLNAAAQNNGIGTVVDKMHDAGSQAFGGQSQISDAKVSTKQAELAETLAKTQQDNAKQAKEQAVKGQDSVNDFAKGIYERAKQVVDRAFG